MAHTVKKVFSYLVLLLNINFNGMFHFGYTQVKQIRPKSVRLLGEVISSTFLIRDRIPRNLIRIVAGLVFVAAPLAVPLTHSPKTGLNPTVTLWSGIILLIINFIIKYFCIKSIGVMPALREKKNLITTGIYNFIRNPLYSSNCMRKSIV